MLSTSREGRGYPAGTMGAQFRARGVPAGTRVRPSASLKRLRLCALMPFGVVAHGVRLPGSLAMVWRSLCALMPFGCGCSWRSAAQIVARVCPSPRLEVVGACWSVCEAYTLDIYIIGETNYFNTKTKNSLFLFGRIKISLYICTRKQ